MLIPASILRHEWSKYIFSICLKPSSSSTKGYHFMDPSILFFFNFLKFIIYLFIPPPHPEPPSLLPSRTIPLGLPSAPAPSIQYHALNLDWRFVSYILYMFQCHSPKSVNYINYSIHAIHYMSRIYFIIQSL